MGAEVMELEFLSSPTPAPLNSREDPGSPLLLENWVPLAGALPCTGLQCQVESNVGWGAGWGRSAPAQASDK
jgi:hypothetical protein